jgi:hypothetical protein
MSSRSARPSRATPGALDGGRARPLVDVSDEVLARLVVRGDDAMLDPAALFVSTRGPTCWTLALEPDVLGGQRRGAPVERFVPEVTPQVMRHTFAVRQSWTTTSGSR